MAIPVYEESVASSGDAKCAGDATLTCASCAVGAGSTCMSTGMLYFDVNPRAGPGVERGTMALRYCYE